MSAMSAYIVALALLGAAPGETTGWKTGEVSFIAYVDTDEHREIYPVCAGQYTVEVSIIKVNDDPCDVLSNVTSVEICYKEPQKLVRGNTVDVTGTYYDGACPIPFCGRVEASSVYKTTAPDEGEDGDDEDDPNIVSPDVVTGSAEATETTVTLRGTLASSGGSPCRVRFIYWKYNGPRWPTEWIEGQSSGAVFSKTIAGLIPNTIYFYSTEAENLENSDTGRTGSFMTLPETVPPIPNPAIWLAEPDQLDTSSIAMMAEVARDVSGPQEYFFDFVSSPTGGAGGSDSLWQFEPAYTDVGLNPNHQYGYRVKGRDGHDSETAYSPVWYAYSAIENPAGVEFGQITTASIQAKSSNALSGLNLGESGLKLENVTAAQVSPWQQNNNFWTSDGLLPNTRYTFRAQARNGDADPTPFSPVAKIYTLAMVPGTTAFSNVNINSILANWNANSNPAGTRFWCENLTSSANSGWITSVQWLDTNLSPNVRYSYHVKARNGDGVETAFSGTINKYTAIESPADVVFGAITPMSIQVRSENTPSGMEKDQSGLRFENLTAGRSSPWQKNNNYWNSDGLLPNRRYDFRAQARNGDGEQSAYCDIASAYTYANVPASAVFANVTTRSIQVQWAHNGNPPGTLYLCENTTAPANSGWTILLAWDNTGLKPNTRYTFRVKAQNTAGAETGFSAETQKYSAIETPEGVTFGTITTSSIEVRSENTPSGLTLGSSGLRFENVTTGQMSAWQQSNQPWSGTGLLPNTPYVFRAQARNGDGEETPYGRTNTTFTLANSPNRADFSYVTDTSIQVNWGANGNPFGTLYRCQNVTNGADSGWIASTSWDSVDLLPFTSYSFRVKARNANGVETAWIDLGQQVTGYRSLSIRSTEGGQVTSPGEGAFQYAPGTKVDLVAAPKNGYHFMYWTGSAVDAGRVTDANAAQTTVLVDAHYTLVANFLRTQIYVDKRAKGASDGSSWENAFTSLQDALDSARKGNEIRVAQGRYTPDIGFGRTPLDYTLSFAMANGAALKGGYAGLGNANPDTRDISAYKTILSGDLKGDDAKVTDVHNLYSEVSRLDNSFHVVTAHDIDNTTLLEGVTIIGGNSQDGAGIQLVRSDIIIGQCTIEQNRSGRLSGDGLAGWGQGAGVSCFYGSPVLLACTFQLNWAGGWGGALHSLKSSPMLRDCLFQLNHAGMEGGALCLDDSSAAVTDCRFQGNRSWDGGAVFANEDSSARLTNCRFLGNAGFGMGGAVNSAGKSLQIINSTFSGNLAFLDGGSLALTGGAGTLTNCSFNRNVSQGALGGGALAVFGATAELANCIVWDQEAPEKALIALQGQGEQEAKLSASYSNVKGGAEGIAKKGRASVTWGNKNLDRDPSFRNAAGADGVAGTADDDLRLRAGSACIDAGNNTAVPLDLDDLDLDEDRTERIGLDLDGLARFVDDTSTPDTGLADAPAYRSIVDLGAYEFTR